MHGPSLPGVCHAEELHYLFSPTLWGMRNTLPSNTDRCEAIVTEDIWAIVDSQFHTLVLQRSFIMSL